MSQCTLILRKSFDVVNFFRLYHSQSVCCDVCILAGEQIFGQSGPGLVDVQIQQRARV